MYEVLLNPVFDFLIRTIVFCVFHIIYECIFIYNIVYLCGFVECESMHTYGFVGLVYKFKDKFLTKH